MKIDSPFTISNQVSFREINGRLMLVIPPEDELFEVNSTGKMIWNHILEKKSLRELYELVAKTYQQEIDRIKPDVDDFIQQLTEQKIINQE